MITSRLVKITKKGVSVEVQKTSVLPSAPVDPIVVDLLGNAASSENAQLSEEYYLKTKELFDTAEGRLAPATDKKYGTVVLASGGDNPTVYTREQVDALVKSGGASEDWVLQESPKLRKIIIPSLMPGYTSNQVSYNALYNLYVFDLNNSVNVIDIRSFPIDFGNAFNFSLLKAQEANTVTIYVNKPVGMEIAYQEYNATNILTIVPNLPSDTNSYRVTIPMTLTDGIWQAGLITTNTLTTK